MNFEAFLTRADESDLTKLIGKQASRILRALSPQNYNTCMQIDLLLNQMAPHKLLSNAESRGIILDLLRNEEASSLCRILDISDLNPRQSLANVNFRGKNLELLSAFFNLEISTATPVFEIPEIQQCAPSYPLFMHQIEASNKVIKCLGREPKRVLLHMPTGAGKTRTAMNIISNQLRSRPEKSIIWLAHSEELCEQAASEFEKAWSYLGSHPVKVRRFWGSRSIDVSDIQGDFIVAGLSKTYSLIKNGGNEVSRIGSQLSLVIMDEAHQVVAETYRSIIECLTSGFTEQPAFIGLSATPGRTWNDVRADEKLSSFFGRNKITLSIPGYENPNDYLVEQGYLAKSNYIPLNCDADIPLSDKEKESLEKELDIPEGVLSKLAESEIRNLLIIKEIKRLCINHKRIIVFAATVAHSDLLACILRSEGIWAKSITGKTDAIDRQRYINEYKQESDEVKIICNFGVLTTGFDAPKTSAALIARPTKSLVLWSQMVGRAIRGKKAGGNDSADVITIKDTNLPGFGNTSEAFFNWEDVWRNR